MNLKKRKLRKYLPPTIKSENILFENGLAQTSSGNVTPSTPSGSVEVYNWDVLGNNDDLINSEPGNSSWQ